MKTIILMLFGLLVMSSLATADDFRDGSEAYERGDFATALAKWKPLAEQGDAPAQNNLGWMYHNGKGVPKDYKQAFYWYTKAIEQGYAAAQNNLGVMYDDGEGVPEDDKQAVYWYTKGAEQGLPKAQNNLGKMYLSGQGVPKDYVKAYLWLSLAAAQGEEEARGNLEILEPKMTAEQIAEAKRLAREWKPR